MALQFSPGVEAITGKFGGGKSYNATREMIVHWLQGGVCCGNVAIKWDEVREEARKRHRVLLRDEQWIPITDEEVPRFYKHIPASADPLFPVLVMLDECAIFLNANDWQKTTAEFRAFLPQPRKYGVRLCLIIQNFDRLLKEVREYVPVKHAYRDASKVEVAGVALNIKLFGVDLIPYFIHSIYDYKQRKDAKPLNTRWVKKERWIYRCYNSFFLHGGAPDLRKVDRVKLEKQPLFPWLRERFEDWEPGLAELILALGGVAIAVSRW